MENIDNAVCRMLSLDTNNCKRMKYVVNGTIKGGAVGTIAGTIIALSTNPSAAIVVIPAATIIVSIFGAIDGDDDYQSQEK